MSHERKKGGERKDHKVARMREDVAKRHAAEKDHPTTDQPDVTMFKSGGPTDKTVQPHVRHDIKHG